MKKTKKYTYSILISLAVILLSFGYLFLTYEEEVDEISKEGIKLEEYNQKIEEIEELDFEVDLSSNDVYQALTEDFKRDVEEVDFGRNNPFRSI